MRGCLTVSSALVFLAGCASAPGEPGRAADVAPPVAAAKPRCDAMTGSRIPRCGLGDDNRETISRQELEARGLPFGSSPPLLDKP